MKRILIPTDFSTCADKAVGLALQLAKKTEARIIFTYINPIPAGGDATFFVDAPLIEANEQKAIEKFHELESLHPELATIPYDFKFEMGFPAQTISKLSEQYHADLIVMGTKGADNKLIEVVGTTTYDVIKQASCPVLAVPESFYPQDVKKIALATDFREDSDDQVIEILIAIAKAFDAEIHVVMVTDDKSNQVIHMNREQMKLWTESFKGVTHHFHFIKNKDVEQGILSYTVDHNIDLIAALPSKLNFIHSLLHKSISKRLVYHSKVPILV